MKKIKKSLSLILAVMMFIVTAVPVFANTLGSITIKNNPDTTGVSMVGHTYSVYKILDVTVKQVQQSSGIDTNRYAYNVVGTPFETFFRDKAAAENEDVSTDGKLNAFAVSYVQKHGDNEDGLTMDKLTKEFKGYIETKNVEPEKTSAPATAEEVVINDIPLGYYMILDNGVAGEAGNDKVVIAAAALGTTGNELVVNLKASAPIIDKEIQDNEGDNWENAGDHQIGDTINFRLVSTVPSDLTGYEKYIYTMTDTMSKGLTFNNDVKIYKDEENKTLLDEAYYTVQLAKEGDPFTVKVHVDILKAINEGALKLGQKIYTVYSAQLNEDALIAGEGNGNKVDLEYSNNPYDDEETNQTPEVEVKDYTFKINGLKTAETVDGEALQGAEFELSRQEGVIFFKETTLEDGTNKYVVCADSHDHASGPECTRTIISGTNGRFEIIGLGDGVEYTLTETKAPEGYNPIDPIKFVITATYDDKGEITGIETNVEGITKQDGTFELGTTIVNKSGDKLPETGGIGTTLFKVIGSIMMIGSAVLLITRRRLSGQEK